MGECCKQQKVQFFVMFTTELLDLKQQYLKSVNNGTTSILGSCRISGSAKLDQTLGLRTNQNLIQNFKLCNYITT